MSGTTISTYSTNGIMLSNPSPNPVTITQTGKINSSLANAIDGYNPANSWMIDNLGTLESTR